jgi:Fe2+ transport system protein FeoA
MLGQRSENDFHFHAGTHVQAEEETGLDRLAPGEVARVAAIDAPDPLATRLADLGFCPGTAVRVVRRAPLGDPVLYELRGYRLALRRGEAGKIRVKRIAAAP